MLEAAKIVALAVAAACSYGIAQDQLTARLSLEYFTVAHPQLIASQTPTQLAFAWGVAATWWFGAALGALLAIAARAGSAPPRDAASLLRPIALVIVATAVSAIALGIAAWFGAHVGALQLGEPVAAQIPPARHARFFAAWGATAGAYAMGAFGAIALCVAVWRDRAAHAAREQDASDARRTPGSALYFGALAGLALLFAAPLALAWWASSTMLRPPWYAHPGPGAALPASSLRDPRSDFALAFEDVAFATEAGATLRGWWMPADDARRCAVVLAGGGWTDRRSLLPLAPALHAAGYGVLAFDYREHGQSDGRGRGASFGWRESRDVAAAAQFLKAQRDAARVAVVGYSMGGSAAILAAAEDPAIDAVVASTPGTTLRDLLATVPETRDVPVWQRELVARLLLLRIGAPLHSVVSGEIGPLHAVAKIAPRPLLLLHGRDDDVNAVADARRLMQRAGPPRQLLIVGGAGHLDVFDDAQGEVPRQIVAFLDARFCPRD